MAQIILNLKKLAEEAVDAEVKRRDLVSVVRCRDCEYVDKWKDYEGERWFNCCMHDDEPTYRFKGDDFCSWGERRKNVE